MSFAPQKPYQPYASVHQDTKGPGDARPTALQIVKDLNAYGKLKGKTVLITGCTAGIGIETARALYETGAKLYLTARDMPKLDKVIEEIVSKAQSKDTPRPEGIEIHLDSLDSVRKGAEEFKKRSNQLNILINNAGVMACPYSTTRDGFETQLGTNHFAHFLLFKLLAPLLVSSASSSHTTSRVINLSSAGHRRSGINFSSLDFNAGSTYDKWSAYGQSKTANIYMASSIERHYGAQGIRGLSVHPGGIQTDLGRHLTQEDYAVVNFAAMQPVMKNVEQGAATTVWAALEPHFDEGNGGRYLAECAEAAPAPEDTSGTRMMDGYHAHIYDKDAEEKLWKLSCEAVGVPEAD